MRSILAAGALALLAVNAQAAEKPAPDYLSAFPPIYDWSGFYAGVHAGYGFGEIVIDSGALNTQHVAGGLIGAQAGYRRQYDRYVFGAEASISAMAIRGTQVCTNPSFTCTGQYRHVATAEGLAGIAFDRTLLFVKGGAAYLQAAGDVDPTYPGYSAGTWGFTVGVGAERALTDKLSLRIDYSFMDFGTITAPAGTLASTAQTSDPIAHLFKIGMNYNF
jgi:opacity protein-like surface antigen